MILPTKHLRPERALISVAARVLQALGEPKTVSRLWEDVRKQLAKEGAWDLPWDWFVLALDLLHVLGTVALDEDGFLVRSKP